VEVWKVRIVARSLFRVRQDREGLRQLIQRFQTSLAAPDSLAALLSKAGIRRDDELVLGVGVYLEDLVEVPLVCPVGEMPRSQQPMAEWALSVADAPAASGAVQTMWR
jgi:hypothetical protein